MATIRPAQPTDVQAHWRHYHRLGKERGRDGAFIYSPVDSEWSTPLETFSAKYGENWGRSVTEIGWERVWVIAEGSEIHGDLMLAHRTPLKSCLHRATLMMGVEGTHRGRGLGGRLMNEAIAWAKAQPSLAWLQLYVFAQNTPAQALYAKSGFREDGRSRDMFRVHGQQVDDVSMVLKLR